MEKLENDLMKIHGAQNLHIIQGQLRKIDPQHVTRLDDHSYKQFLQGISGQINYTIG